MFTSWTYPTLSCCLNLEEKACQIFRETAVQVIEVIDIKSLWDIYIRLWIHFLVAFYLRFQSPLNSFLVPETAMFIFRIRQFFCVSWRFSHRENKWSWCSLSLKNQIFMVIYRYSLSQPCAFLSKIHFTVEKNFLSRLSKINSYYSDK